ncbi:hypothetical protein HPP92_002437 [Vanilla planifolia]|uniref:Uncharacterized protein n=1 Tax=Vanilla planifolia TaxID=51239 RepID=A0A835S0A5_VANPL|nr:hypothetical protein HPP92_002437 [Vanilla planifolia]
MAARVAVASEDEVMAVAAEAGGEEVVEAEAKGGVVEEAVEVAAELGEGAVEG